MALIAPVFALLGRFVSRFLNIVFGWASSLLFGQVPQSKQLLLSGISLGSIVWAAALVGVVLPDVGSFLVAAIPVPDWIDEGWVRLAMLIVALTLPILVGIGGLFIVDAADRPQGRQAVIQVLRGYPYAMVLALTLLLMLVVAPVRKARSLLRRWEDGHIPIVVKPGGYDRVANDIEGAVDRAGLDITRSAAPRVLEMPSRVLAAVGGPGVRRLVPDRLLVLKRRDLEVMIHPSDIAISGRKSELARARAAIASRMTFTAAYLTTTKESQQIEDRLEAIARKVRDVDGEDAGAEGRSPDFEPMRSQLHDVDSALATLDVEYDEWEVLYRQRLQVERDLLSGELAARDRARSGPLASAAEVIKGALS